MAKFFHNRIRAVCAMLLILMLVVCMMPMGLFSQIANATNEITVYFDTSCVGSSAGCTGSGSHGTHNWAKDMGSVYYYVYSSSGSYGPHAMTATQKAGSDGGYLFSATVDKDSYSYIIFLSRSSWKNDGNDYLWQTKNYGLSGVSDKSIFMLNTSGYGDGDMKKQGLYVSGTYKESESFQGQSFSFLNMDDTAVTLDFVFTDETRNLTTEVWNSDKTIETTVTRTFDPRSYYFKGVEVPDSQVSGKPYQTVEIKTTGGQSLKKYYFPQGKILDRTFWYGITDFQSSTPMTYGDGTKLCYQSGNLDNDIPAGNGVVYLEKTSFPKISSPPTVKGTSTQLVSKKGNATYETTANITTDAYTAPAANAAAQIYDLSNSIFSVVYNGVQYNLFWSRTASDNLVTVNDNVAVLSGVFTVQSTDNTLTEDGKTYKYITTQADFYDYQYDKFNSGYYNPEHSNGGSYLAGYSSGGWPASEKGNAKRPYMVINEALNASSYSSSSTNYPMYLGQFWLPLWDSSSGYGTSSQAYTSTTAEWQRAAHNGDNDEYLSDGRTASDYSKTGGFGEKLRNFDWSANLAFRYSDQAAGTYEPYNAVVQGLVYNKLSSSGKLMAKNNSDPIPYFDYSWWTDASRNPFSVSMTDSNNVRYSENLSDYINVYENYDFPFFETAASDIEFINWSDKTHLVSNTSRSYSGTYYVFNSTKNAVKVDTTTQSLDKHYNDDNFKVGDNYGSDGTDSETGFFPFNSKDDSDSSKLHYGFGVKFSIDFYLTENGTIDGTTGGIPITFTFQGDDDMWVFLDDQLILDMGGAHKNSIGEINFADKKVFIGAAAQAGASVAVDTTPYSSTKSFSALGFADNSDYLTTGKHKITMYYLERGMLNSNLYVMFNLPLDLTTWELQTDTDFSLVNAGFQNPTRYVADQDVFNFAVQNKDTTNVVGSEFRNPTTSTVTRSNSESGSAVTTGLSPPDGVTVTTQNVVDSNNLYIDTSSLPSWVGSGDMAAVIFYNESSVTSEKKAKLQFATAVPNETNLYCVPYDSAYSKFQVVRVKKEDGYSPQVFTGDGRLNAVKEYLYSVNGYENTNEGKKGYYNMANETSQPLALSTNNRFKITGWTNSWSWGSNYTKTIEVPNVTPHTYDFVGSSSGYTPLMHDLSNGQGVTYGLVDMFAGNNEVVYDTRTVGTTPGVVSLQYGEIATFSKQLNYGSAMIVEQLNDLSAPSGGSRANSTYNDSTGRTSQKYYNTYMRSTPNSDGSVRRLYAGVYLGDAVEDYANDHVETMYGTDSGGTYQLKSGLKNYSSNHVVNPQQDGLTLTYVFSDPTDAGNGYVYLRQVVVNEVKTASLKISKNILSGESTDETFSFTVTFSNIFGSQSGDSLFNPTGVTYSLYNASDDSLVNTSTLGTGGAFAMKAGQYIMITGIPVGTKYYVTETSAGSSENFQLASDYCENLGSSGAPVEVTDDTIAIAYNNRQTGSMTLKKMVYDLDGTTPLTGNTAEFTVKVTLTAPAGVNLSGYDIQCGGTHVTFLTETTSFNATLTPGNTLTVTGLPYGTTYTVTEEDVPFGYERMNNNVVYTDNAKRIGTNAIDDDVTINNRIIPIVMPTTGGSGVILIFPFGILAITLSGAAFVIYKRRMTSGRKAAKGRYARK